ncbi:M14 family metallopeptidase [Bacillus sp. FJAT-27225]|uniref:M14 family metallopeptidase n=1 Tax=Bacillus sp. FJAT-27225 TaxID=1743144 RepID=UPI000980ABFC|nr:M14 family metallopeptidase [Bacillus sp. FJAT-27225]
MKKPKKLIQGFVMATALTGLGFSAIAPGFAGAERDKGEAIPKEESISIVELEVPDRKALDKLEELGVTLDHGIHQHGDGYEVEVVATPSQIALLKKNGIQVKDTLLSEGQFNQNVAERNEALQIQASVAAAEDTIKVLRGNHYTNQSGTFLYVEAKSSGGTSASTALTAKWDEGGQEKTVTMSRFVDYGEYMYHWFEVPVTAVPKSVTITSNQGGTASTAVTEWLGDRKAGNPKKHYVTNFVDHYMDPTELYERAEQLAKEFPDLVEIIEMPNKTNGYRRLAQATMGALTTNAVVVSSKAWGHEGGNNISVEFVNPGVASAPLTVKVDGKKITVELATNASGAAVSTARQVVDALNKQASSLVTATTYRGNAGTGAVTPVSAKLSDNLKAPDNISREPQTVKAIRIGKHRDGSKPGVLGYAQEHAREWVTPLVTIETAERLLRNYAHDGETKQLVNNLDIFLVPSVNPDGGHYSFYDFNMQRRNMTNHCGPNESDPAYRNAWGVDLNRNHSVGSAYDGFVGASTTNCRSDTYAGPAENSEPEAKNLVWLADQNPNIKFAMNIHSHGGYFMWSPGAYDPNRVTLPRPTAGQEAFYWAASNEILTDIKEHRGTVIKPSRTGPIPDVLYSAAGNSADYLWYEKGIYAWNFEVGAQLWNKDTNRWVSVGFQPPYEEGHEEAMEFANGLIGLIKVAYNQSKDKQPPSTKAVPGNGKYSGPVNVAFETNEAATIYYTLDGSKPTFESAHIRLAGTREPAEVLKVDKTTIINWFAVDAAGNIEKNYNPLTNSKNFNSVTITIK